MKTLYVKPSVEIYEFDAEDAITTSFKDEYYQDPDELIVDQQGSQYNTP